MTGIEAAADALRNEILEARRRIGTDVRHTPTEHSAGLSRRTGARVHFKWESDQTTGSFKLRGALNKLRLLTPEERRRGVVSASTGNHGLAVAHAARLEGVALKLFLPANVAAGKRQLLESTGVPLEFYGDACEKTEIYARAFAGTAERSFISPYNDADVVAGQGTVGLEIAEDVPGVQDILVPLGGGGLACGIAAAFLPERPEPRVYGVEPVNSAFMSASLSAGKIVEIPERPTVADAVTGGLEPGAITFPLCRDLLAGVIVVEEPIIVEAMTLIFREHGRRVEPAAALSLAGLLRDPARFAGRTVVCVASGGNITTERFREITGAA